MSNLDEDKVKRLLYDLVGDIENLIESNLYRKDLFDSMRARIRKANLLQDQPACATMKKQAPAIGTEQRKIH